MRALAAGLILVVLAYLGATAGTRYGALHHDQVMAWARDAAAAGCVLAATGILAACARAVSRHTGTHDVTSPVSDPVPDPFREALAAPMAVPGHHPGYTLHAEHEDQPVPADNRTEDVTVL